MSMQNALRVETVGGGNWAAALAVLKQGGYVVYRG